MINCFSKFRFHVAAVGLAIGIAGIASADEVHLVGSTLGRFNAQGFAANNSLLGLTYDNSTFDNTTVAGALDLGGNPSPGTNFNNLGSFTLSQANDVYDGNTFELYVTFTSPVTIVGGTSTTFVDKLFGTISNGVGGVFVDFDNTPQTFFYTNATETGSFTMFVNDVSIAPNQSASLTGHVIGSQQSVPEPTALAGIFCGALGLISRRRRNRKV